MSADPIDALARALPPYQPAASRVEQVRTAVLAGAATVTHARPASRRVTYALLAVALVAALAAAATVVAMLDRPAAGPVPDAPTESVPSGMVGIDAGEIIEPVAPPPATVSPPPVVTAPRPPQKPRLVQRAPIPPAPPPVGAPGEAEFRAGWTALKAGEPASAAASFAAARLAKGSAVTEDASFWEGIALARAGSSSRAIAALRRFLDTYPSSSRAGEAAAKLGWLLYDAGELEAAERYFTSASGDAVPKVQKSARDGLEAVARKQRAAP